MKINTYKDELVFNTFASNFYKKAVNATELGQEIVKVLDDLVQSGVKLTPELVQATKALQDSVALAAKDTEEAMTWISALVEEFARINSEIASGSLVDDLAKAQDEIARLTRSRTDLLNKWRKLKDSDVALKKQYQEAVDAALAEKGVSEKVITELRDEIGALKGQIDQANSAFRKQYDQAGILAEQLKQSDEALGKAQSELVGMSELLEKYKKENAELLTKYEKLIQESQEAASKAQAAKQAGAPAAVVEGLEQTAKAKEAAADTIATTVTKGDEKAKEALKADAKAKSASSSGKTKPAPTTESAEPGLEAVKPGSNTKAPASLRQSLRQGVSEGTKEYVKNTLKNVSVSSLILGPAKLLAGLAIVAFLGYELWANGPTLWEWWAGSTPDAKEKARTFDALLKDAYTKLSKVSFKQQTSSLQAQQNYLAVMKTCFDILPAMANRPNDRPFITKQAQKLQTLFLQTDSYLDSKDAFELELASKNGWPEAITAITSLQESSKVLVSELEKAGYLASQQSPEARLKPDSSTSTPSASEFGSQTKPEPDPNDKGINVLGEKVYLSQYSQLDPATRSAAPFLIKKVLLTPTGLSFWDPENKWGGGYLQNTGSISDQVIRHIRFFMNPRAIDSDWAYGPISNESQLKKFMRKNMPKASRKHDSGYKSTRREYRHHNPKLSFDKDLMENNMKNREKRLEIIEKIANSTNIESFSMKDMFKKADNFSKEYYQVALQGLDDQYAKSYYAGLKSMYDKKLPHGDADYKKLYEVFGHNGTEILQESHPQSIMIADAKGRGGLVENGLEQQRHNIGVALSAPTGNFRGKHANLIETLKKFANIAIKENNLEESRLLLDAVKDIEQIISMSK